MTTPKQTTLFEDKDYKRGDMIIIGENSWTFVRYSDNGKRMLIERDVNDGKTRQWMDIKTDPEEPVPPQPTEQSPEETISHLVEMKKFCETNIIANDNNDDKEQGLLALDRALQSLRGETNHIRNLEKELADKEDDLDQQKTLVLIANRQAETAKAETIQEKATAHTIKPVDPAEIQELNQRIKSLEAENTRLQKEQIKPLVEVKSLVHKIDMREGVHDEPEIAELMADGYEPIPVPAHYYSKPEWSNFELERIIFRRDNKQPIHPHHPYADAHASLLPSHDTSGIGVFTEIENNLDTQADRDNPIIQQSELQQSGSELKQAGNAQAHARAQSAYNASRATRQPITMAQAVGNIVVTGESN